MMEQTADSSSVLAEELREVVHQAEALLQALGDDSDEALEALRERVYQSIDAAKSRLADMEAQGNLASQRAATAAESWVHDNPWTAVAIAAAVGLVIGTLLARRRPTADD